MARPNLRQRARQQAHAEVAPQVHRARSSAKAQHRSINSSVPAIEAGLEDAAKSARHAGLAPHDLQILLKSFANQQADAAASAVLQNQQVGQSTREEIGGLKEQEGASSRSILSQLQLAAQEHAQSVQDAQRSNTEELKNALIQAEVEKSRGLGDYGQSPLEEAEAAHYKHEDSTAGGLTPTQARAAAESAQTAHSYASNLVRSVHENHGVNPSTGKQVLPAHPKNWSDQNWAELTEKVAGSKGVNNYKDAESAIDAIRSHFQPGQTPPATPTQAGAQDLGKAIGHTAANPLAPILQFGAQLLHHG